MSKSDFNNCTPVSYNTNLCGGPSVVSCGIHDYRFGNTQKPPFTNDLAYNRGGTALLPGSVMHNPTGITGSFVSCFGAPDYSIVVDPNETLRLYGRLFAQIKGHDFSPGVSLGEMNETCGMLGSASKALAKGVSQLGSRFRHVVPSSAWLAAVYGWAPLWGDLHAGAEFFASAFNKPRKRRYSASLTTKGVAVSASPSNWVASGTASRRVAIVAHVSEDGTNLAYLGVLNPLEVAWELTPYSFVADWFIPFGSWLQMRSNLNDLKATGCISTKIRWNTTAARLINPSFRMLEPPKFRGSSFVRTPGLPSLPLPKFKPLSQSLSNWRHWVDGFALASQAFGNIKVGH